MFLPEGISREKIRENHLKSIIFLRNFCVLPFRVYLCPPQAQGSVHRPAERKYV